MRLLDAFIIKQTSGIKNKYWERERFQYTVSSGYQKWKLLKIQALRCIVFEKLS